MNLKSIIKLCSTLLIIFSLYSCGIGFQYTTLNHAGHIDGIYSSNNYTVDTLSDFQVRHKLRTDFNFRYDIAQYALSQPASFDWNNRLLGNRYNWNRPYWGYSYYWDRTQMWNDWVWGYNYLTPYRWSPFGYDRWGYGIHYGWNNHGWGWNNYYGNGWNNYYGWNTGYGYNLNRYNRTSNINGRRGSVINQRRVTPNRTNSVRTTPTRTNNVTPRNIRSSETRIIKNRRPKTIIPPVRTNNNTRPVRTNTRPTYNNSRPVRTNNNTRPVRTKSNRKSN